MEFTCTAHQSGPQLIATVAGDVDLAIHPRFRAEAQVWVGKHTDVVLDCSGVTFMDSMGLRVLVELWRGVTEAGHSFALARPSTSVTRVLELAGLVGVFDYVELPAPAAEELAA